MFRSIAIALALLIAMPAAVEQVLGIGFVKREGTKSAQGVEGAPRTHVRVDGALMGVPARAKLEGPATILSHDPALPPLALPIQGWQHPPATIAPASTRGCGASSFPKSPRRRSSPTS